MRPIVIDIDKIILKIKEFKLTEFFKNEWMYFLAVWRNFFKQKDFWKYFAFVYFVYFLGYFALLRNNINYRDDIARANEGYFGFLDASRHLSEFLSKILHMSLKQNTDISPITQLIAIAILSFGSLVLVKIILKKQSFFGLLASTPLGLSPFFFKI